MTCYSTQNLFDSVQMVNESYTWEFELSRSPDLDLTGSARGSAEVISSV